MSNADPKARAWADSILRQAHGLSAPQGPLAVRLAFRMPTPKKPRHGAPHTFRPDADNLAKLALDALMRAGLFPDDAAVSHLTVSKTWAPSHQAGLDIAVVPDLGVRTQDTVAAPSWLAQEPV